MSWAAPVVSGILLIVALTACFLMMFRRLPNRVSRPEVWFAISVTLLAVSYGFWKAPGSVVTAAPVSKEKGCAGIRREMTPKQLRETAGEPHEVVSEADTRGPGAEAWVYVESRCVAHLLDGRVRRIEYD